MAKTLRLLPISVAYLQYLVTPPGIVRVYNLQGMIIIIPNATLSKLKAKDWSSQNPGMSDW